MAAYSNKLSSSTPDITSQTLLCSIFDSRTEIGESSLACRVGRALADYTRIIFEAAYKMDFDLYMNCHGDASLLIAKMSDALSKSLCLKFESPVKFLESSTKYILSTFAELTPIVECSFISGIRCDVIEEFLQSLRSYLAIKGERLRNDVPKKIGVIYCYVIIQAVDVFEQSISRIL
eukprot:308794_1